MVYVFSVCVCVCVCVCVYRAYVSVADTQRDEGTYAHAVLHMPSVHAAVDACACADM